MRCLSIAAAALAFAIGAAPAMAVDDLEGAKKAVSAATDEQLLAEFRRRYDARTRPRARDLAFAPAPELAPAPGAVSELAKYDEVTLVRAVKLTARAIYGPKDERQDFYDLTDDGLRTLARATVALFTAGAVQPSGAKVSIKTKTLREAEKLCPGEKFEGQPSGAFCSGTLIAPDTVLTAGHCVSEISGGSSPGPVSDTRFVFGYWMSDATTPPKEIPSEQVFSGKEAINGEFSETRDWAVVRLDRPVPETLAKPVIDWAVEPLRKDQKVFTFGFPSGIPLKYAPNAPVRDIKQTFYVAELSTFSGNSGSGVYDQATKKLAGVLVRGEVDYLKDNANKCQRVHFCPRGGCRGEDVTRIDIVRLTK
jgi:V8-like Glu-specific endopeptidase